MVRLRDLNPCEFNDFDARKISIPAPEAIPVTLLLWVEHNFVRKWVRLACCDWRYVIFVPIHNVDYFQSCLLQRAFHRSSYLFSFLGREDMVSTVSCNRIFKQNSSPPSVFGLAMVTSTSHSSQITSSSLPLPIPVSQPLFLLFLSKNCTAICPRTPPLGVFEEVSWCIRVVVLASIRVSNSGGSAMYGSVISRCGRSRREGRIEGK
jgi:hypothetical protein